MASHSIYPADKQYSPMLPSTASSGLPPSPSFLASHKKLFLSLLAISAFSFHAASSFVSDGPSSIASTLASSLAPASPHGRFDARLDAPIDFSLVQGGAQCVQPSPVPIKKGEENRSDFVYDDEFKKLEVERFLGAIRVPTQMYDDMAHAVIDGPDFDKRYLPFLAFHDYLHETFPLLHAKADLAKPNRFNLVYTLRGSSPELKPLVLTAHQDVVPAETSLEKWTYPPFKAVFDGEIVWGRGSSDTKNSLIGIMAAIEHLIEGGWDQRRTVVLAFGFDEEIGGPQGASTIGQYLLEQYGKDGVAMIVDEGGSGVEDRAGKTFLMPGTGEKGMISARFTVETAGGHSSTPSPHTSIGLLSRIVVAVEDAALFPPTLHPSSPIYGYLTCLATHGNKSALPRWLTSAFKGKQTQRSLDELASKFAEDRGRMGGEYLVRTSKAATLLEGGHKLNALPESATVTFNSRIDFSQTPEQVLDIYQGPVIPIAKLFNLTLISHNSTVLYSPDRPEGTITLGTTGENGLPVAPLTPLRGPAYDLFAWAGRRVFGKEGTNEVIVAPSAATGNTDTKHYWSLTKNIYRFVPRRVGTTFAAHTVDERILFRTHQETIEWFHELIIMFNDVKTDEGF